MNRQNFRTTTAILLGVFLFLDILFFAFGPANVEATTGTVVVVDYDGLNVRTGPGTGNPVIKQVDKGTRMPYVKTSSGGYWYQVKYDGTNLGWVHKNYCHLETPPATVVPRDPSTFARQVHVLSDNLNVRTGPSKTNTIIGVAKKGMIFGYLGEKTGWYQVALANNKVGWIYGDWARVNIRYHTFNFYYRAVTDGWTFVLSSDAALKYTFTEDSAKNQLVFNFTNLPHNIQQQKVYALNKNGVSSVSVTPQDGNKLQVAITYKGNIKYKFYRTAAGNIRIYTSTKDLSYFQLDTLTVQKDDPYNPPDSIPYLGDKVTLKGKDNAPVDYSYTISGRNVILEVAAYRQGSFPAEITRAGNLVQKAKFEIMAGAPRNLRITLQTAKEVALVPLDRAIGNSASFILVDKTLSLAGRKIVVDPGHGGYDPGAVGPTNYYEKTFNLSTGKKLWQTLERRGAVVYLTRTTDIYVPLNERAAFANSHSPDLFLSIHANASANRSVRGTSTWFYAPQTRPELYSQYYKRKTLADKVQAELLLQLGSQRWGAGVIQDNFCVLRETKMPSALVETLFISNSTDESILKKDSTHQKAATAMANGINQYFTIYK